MSTKKSVLQKQGLDFFLEALEVRALKPKSAMDFANHIHDLTEVVDPIHGSNVFEFFETRKSHRENV